MAWSTPSSQVTGDLITATIWNQNVVNNTKYLKGQAGAVILEDVITGAAGTAAAPSYSFSAEATIGMYRPAAATLGWSIASALELQLTATALLPGASDGLVLGSGTLMFADLFLANGAVINFNNGDVTITHSANVLAFAGAATNYTFDSFLDITAGGLRVKGSATTPSADTANTTTFIVLAGGSNAGALDTGVGLRLFRSTTEYWNLLIDSSTATVGGVAMAVGDLKIYDASAAAYRAFFDISDSGRLVLGGGWTSGAVNHYINDTSNASMTTGLTINQGAADDSIFELKSSDVAHGITTSWTETDTYGHFFKVAAVAGGLDIGGSSSATTALRFHGAGITDDVTKSTAATAYIEVVAAKKAGSGRGNPGADANLLAVRLNDGTTRFILDSDGDSHQDVGTAWTNFDTHDDLALLNTLSAHVTHQDDPLRNTLGGWLAESREPLEALKVVAFNADGHHFVNMSRLQMLTIGAVRQLGQRVTEIENSALFIDHERRLAALEAR